MKPRQIISLSNERDIYIQSSHDDIESYFARFETWIYTQLIQKISPHLITNEQGQLLNSTNIVKITAIIEAVFKSFRERNEEKAISYIFKRLDKISDLTATYYNQVSEKSFEDVKAIVGTASNRIDNNLGLTRGREKLSAKRGSKLKKITTGEVLKNSIQSTVLSYVQAELPFDSLTAAIDKNVTGGANTLNEDSITKGGLNKEIEETVFVTSRQKNAIVAQSLAFEYYLYSGTKLEKGTRPFCGGGYDKVCGCTFKNKIGKAFHISEVEQWEKQKWSGKPKENYNPFSNMGAGGYNCRHDLLGISKEVYEYVNR